MTRVACITGGGSGIGRAVAQILAARGWCVVVAGRRRDRLDETVQMVRAAGGRAECIAVDLLVSGGADAAIDLARSGFGRLDALVAAAGVPGMRGRFHEVDDSAWREIMDGNLGTTVRAVRAALPMIEQSAGTIVTIASALALRASADNLAYAVAKASVIALTRGLALQTASAGVRVVCICPGVTVTPMTEPQLADLATHKRVARGIPAGRFATADEVARVIAWTLSEEAAYVTGAVIPVDGGLSIA